jgi:dihydroneopterin aldolase/2-amino-4-hydroxy-6-hydroxymethyldihydropteridine diphosphokinase
MSGIIQIQNIAAWGKHGVKEKERQNAQLLVIDLDLTVDLSLASASDSIEDTVDYSHVRRVVTQIVESTSFKLLEALCGKILDELAKDTRILAAKIRIAKPAKLAGATPSVTLTRYSCGKSDLPEPDVFPKRHIATIGIGSNIGDARENVRLAIEYLANAGELVACSRLYMTKPWGVVDQADFCNAVVKLRVEMSPRQLLSELKRIEQIMGRKPSYRWGPRVIDLDILMMGDLVVTEPDLVIPHPGMLERTFVLLPLAEIDARFKNALEALGRTTGHTLAPISDSCSLDNISVQRIVKALK